MARPGRIPSVELWIIDLDADAGTPTYGGSPTVEPWTWLDAAERAGADAARALRDRQRRAASHVALRAVLGAWLGRAPGTIELGRAPCPLCGEPHGRPLVVERPDRSFSLARADRFAAVARSADGTVGVDIEISPSRASADDLAAARTPIEDAELLALPAERRDGAALRAWTRKEALLKGWGTGLGVDPAAVPVGLGWDPERSPTITSMAPTIELTDDGIREEGWTVTDVRVTAREDVAQGDVACRMAAAIVSPRPARSTRAKAGWFRRWPRIARSPMARR